MTNKAKWRAWLVFAILYFLTVGAALAHENPVPHSHASDGTPVPVFSLAFLVASLIAAAVLRWRASRHTNA